MNIKKNFIMVGTEKVNSSISREDAEKIFLKKVKEAEKSIDRGEYMTSEQAHAFLDV